MYIDICMYICICIHKYIFISYEYIFTSFIAVTCLHTSYYILFVYICEIVKPIIPLWDVIQNNTWDIATYCFCRRILLIINNIFNFWMYKQGNSVSKSGYMDIYRYPKEVQKLNKVS